ncbi:hypothetical protein C8F04DRAFT_1180775 [Mycena alexandri]|uniref:Uncharacterized protein n=1 Tax=Mycena alexandri TaxID=1745969 RepID=A0AAD6T074_9AGAR|nr:hypothetical protein C8F04DRAFT_1180775 [Mycena alexandri]
MTGATTPPVGMVWDSTDYSCGYDATLGILTNMWLHNPGIWTPRFRDIGPYFDLWVHLLEQTVAGLITLEAARDTMRARMHLARPEYFPYGPNGTSIDRIAMLLLPVTTHAEALSNAQSEAFPDGFPVADWIRSNLSRATGPMVRSTLRGIVYGGAGHFTVRYLTADGTVWFHDGIATGRRCIQDGHLDTIDLASLSHARGKLALTLASGGRGGEGKREGRGGKDGGQGGGQVVRAIWVGCRGGGEWVYTTKNVLSIVG